MTVHNGIVIRNIFHMLAYAFKGLKHKNFEKIAYEPFEHIEDLLAAILLRGITQQIKQGLHRSYLLRNEAIDSVRGRVLIPETIRYRINRRQRIECQFDELTVDNLFNRILKAGVCTLLRSDGVKKEIRLALKKSLSSMANVSAIDLNCVCWSRLQVSRQTQTYELLLNICRLIHLHSLHTEQSGKFRLEQWLDESSLAMLYQRFLLNYFREHHPYLLSAAKQIPWDSDGDAGSTSFLPVMISDVILTSVRRVLVIDAKFYSKTLQSHHEKATFHSHNLYQIFTYVQNLQAQILNKEVAGMLLYAKTQEAVVPNETLKLHGNTFSLRTLDLNCEFSSICQQLDEIATTVVR